MDSDPFRDARYVFVLKSTETIFGPGGDIKPLSLNVVRNHCKVQVQNVNFHELLSAEGQTAGMQKSPRISSTRMSLIEESPSFDENLTRAKAKVPEVTLTGGNGEVYVNGSYIGKGATLGLKHLDRVVIGGELLLLKFPELGATSNRIFTADEAIEEYQEGLANARLNPGVAGDGASEALRKQMQDFEKQRKAFEDEKRGLLAAGASAAEIQSKEQKQRMVEALNKELMEMMVQTKQAERLAYLLDRESLAFETTIATSIKYQISSGEAEDSEKTHDESEDRVRVQVSRKGIEGIERVILEPFEFTKGVSIMRDEVQKLTTALEAERRYEVDEVNDPYVCMFDNMTCIAVGTLFLDFSIYNLPADDDEKTLKLRQPVAPFQNMGVLEMEWEPLPGLPDLDGNIPDGEVQDILEPEDLLGKSWTYGVRIRQAVGVPMVCKEARAHFHIFGMDHESETVEQSTSNPVFIQPSEGHYTAVLHIPRVTQEHLDTLSDFGLEVQLYASPVLNPSRTILSTENETIRSRLLEGKQTMARRRSTLAFKTANGKTKIPIRRLDDAEALVETDVEALRKENEALKRKLTVLENAAKENDKLADRVHYLESLLTQHNVPFDLVE